MVRKEEISGDVLEWLGTWGDIEAPGKHTPRYPAGFCCGYVYTGPRMRYVPQPVQPEPTMWDRVNRAIPVDGTVTETPPSWKKSPQVRFWLEKEGVPIWQRIKRWLRSPA